MLRRCRQFVQHQPSFDTKKCQRRAPSEDIGLAASHRERSVFFPADAGAQTGSAPILGRSGVVMSQNSYTMGKAVDSQLPGSQRRPSKMHQREAPCVQAEIGRLNADSEFALGVQDNAVLLDGEMAEWLKAAVC